MQAGSSIGLLVGVYCEFQSGISLWFNVCEELLCSLSLTVIRAMYCVREWVGFIHKGQLGCIIIPFVVQMVIEFTQGTTGVNLSFLVQLVIQFIQGAVGVHTTNISRGNGVYSPFIFQMVIEFTQGAIAVNMPFMGQWGVLTIHISDGN